MFNAPDARCPGEVPVGHFVTRAIAHLLDNTLSPGRTAADLRKLGPPYGFSLDSFIPALLEDLAGRPSPARCSIISALGAACPRPRRS